MAQTRTDTTSIAGYTVHIRRTKGQRSLRLRCNADGSLTVSGPWFTTEGEVRKMVESRIDWIEQQMARLADTPKAKAELATEAERKEWRAIVEPATKILLEKWEPIMGVHAEKLAFRSMKSRWGSCQPATGRICINTRLALYPPDCLEYVVVHELAHLLEPNHSKRFYGILDTCLPTWKASRDKLR